MGRPGPWSLAGLSALPLMHLDPEPAAQPLRTLVAPVKWGDTGPDLMECSHSLGQYPAPHRCSVHTRDDRSLGE